MKKLHRLNAFDALILADIGYIQQDRDEMEVLFTLLAERYERRSVVVTSNLVFSQWDRIFKDPMTTPAAIDRIVHHAVILELMGRGRQHLLGRTRLPSDGFYEAGTGNPGILDRHGRGSPHRNLGGHGGSG